MRIIYLLIFLMMISVVQAHHDNTDIIRGDLGSRYYSLQHRYRYGQCHWEYGKGTVCNYKGEELPYHQEMRLQTVRGNVRVRDLAHSVTPRWQAPRGSTTSPDYISNKNLGKGSNFARFTASFG